MNVYELLKFAKKYSDLGDSIQEQLDDIMDDNFDDVNPNALSVMIRSIKGYDDQIDEALQEALEHCSE